MAGLPVRHIRPPRPARPPQSICAGCCEALYIDADPVSMRLKYAFLSPEIESGTAVLVQTYSVRIIRVHKYTTTTSTVYLAHTRIYLPQQYHQTLIGYGRYTSV